MNKQTIKYDNLTIVQQAQNYTDVYRILAEYIDNSIDSAEELYNKATESYSRNIEITVTKSSKGKKNRTITITDNACGMRISPNGEYTIFKSDKKEDPSTNGMYGMGMFSFLSVCEKMSVETKKQNSLISYEFEINKKIFEIPNDKSPEYNLHENSVASTDKSSWTKITLSDFHPGKYEEIDLDNLKEEIETHFELILKRKNIKIIFQENTQILKAEPFDYSTVSANSFTKDISTLYKINSKKQKTETSIDISKSPCKIYLVVSSNMELNRNPVFINKGRRIIEISKVDQFRSNQRSSIWSNPNVTGYISVTGILEPTPTRKDFRSTNLLKALFYTLNKLEPEIKDFVENETKINFSNKLNEIEKEINSALDKYLQKSQREIPKYQESPVQSTSPGASDQTEGIKTKGSSKNTSGKNKTKNPKRDKNSNIEIPESEQIHSGIKIKFDTNNNPQVDVAGNPLRSIFRNSIIIIYKKHQDFLNKMPKSMNGNYKFEEKTILYISMEIVTHLKSEQEAETSEDKYVKFVTAVYDLEGYLVNLKGKKI